MYIGQYNATGNLYIAAFKDQKVRIYDVNNDYELIKDIQCLETSWTVSDTCISPDQKFLLYSSLNPDVHLVNVGRGGDGGVRSIANVTDIHERLAFNGKFFLFSPG